MNQDRRKRLRWAALASALAVLGALAIWFPAAEGPLMANHARPQMAAQQQQPATLAAPAQPSTAAPAQPPVPATRALPDDARAASAPHHYAVTWGESVRRAAQSGTAEEAFGAYNQIGFCAHVDEHVASALRMIDSNPEFQDPKSRRQIVDATTDFQQQCPTITASERALKGLLLEKAFDAGLVGVATAYLRHYPNELPEGRVDKLRSLLLRDVTAVDAPRHAPLSALEMVLTQGHRVGIDRFEREVHLQALAITFPDHPMVAIGPYVLAMNGGPSLSPERAAQARREAEFLVQRQATSDKP
jgi:hypothetical protein